MHQWKISGEDSSWLNGKFFIFRTLTSENLLVCGTGIDILLKNTKRIIIEELKDEREITGRTTSNNQSIKQSKLYQTLAWQLLPYLKEWQVIIYIFYNTKLKEMGKERKGYEKKWFN